MRVFWGRMVAPVPLDSCPAREPLRMALAGATRRCFALLRLSRRGAMMGCGERLRSAGVGVGACGSVGRVAANSCPACDLGCGAVRRCFDLFCLMRRAV